MALNQKVICTVDETIFKLDSRGNQTGETVELSLYEGKPERSSNSEFATYLINYDDSKIYFRYAMNTQSGLIQVLDKKSGANAKIDLRIDDLVNKPYIIGSILIENDKKLKLLGATEPVHLRATCFIRNESNHFLNGSPGLSQHVKHKGSFYGQSLDTCLHSDLARICRGFLKPA